MLKEKGLKMYEEPIIGQKAIGRMMGVSRQTVGKKKDELMAYGVIWKTWRGRPPRIVYCAFPSEIKRYCSFKSTKKEMV